MKWDLAIQVATKLQKKKKYEFPLITERDIMLGRQATIKKPHNIMGKNSIFQLYQAKDGLELVILSAIGVFTEKK